MSLLRLHRTLENTQYATARELRAYQSRRLERVLDTAFRCVPHYREQLQELGLHRQDFCGPEDLSKLPILQRCQVAGAAAARFLSESRSGHRPQWVTTSGTGGMQLRLLMDKPSNVLEFAYYWRHWSWAGYRLGDPFAELSTVAFLREPALHRYQRMGRRLLLNSISLSPEIVRAQWHVLRDLRPRFIKGLASVLYHFASFVKEAGLRPHGFRAVFSTGETLLPFQRRLIEEVLDCKVFDSYGQMERLIAISECPQGRMHLHADYGLLEVEPSDKMVTPHAGGSAGSPTGAMIGTGLYNLSMPLLRYRIGDLIELPASPQSCPCGRTLPVVTRISGRQSEAVRTADGRVIAAPFLVFEGIPGVRYGRVVQEEPRRLRIHVVREPGFDRAAHAVLLDRLRAWFGREMELGVELYDERELPPRTGKKQPFIGP